MTPDAFVAVASGLALVKATTVMGSVRLAVSGKTFATVGWPQAGWAVVRLTPDDQRGLMTLSNALTPERGRRGGRGVTLVCLAKIDELAANRLLVAAWRYGQVQASQVTARAS